MFTIFYEIFQFCLVLGVDFPSRSSWGPWEYFRGVDGVGARCGNGLFSTYKSPKFYLSFTILVSVILVRYPDRIGLVNAMIWPRILVFTSMMLRVLTPAAFGSYGAGIYIPKLGLVPKHVRPVRPVANLYDLLTS